MKAAIFDLDGVVRNFEESIGLAVAARHDIELDRMASAVFERHRLERLVSGRLSRAEWVREAGEAAGVPDAVAEWLDGNFGKPDPDVVQILDELRAAKVPVAVLTNGSDTVGHELSVLGIRDRFDLVLSSWYLGVAKPNPSAFLKTCGALEVAPEACFFTDDRLSNVEAALGLGISGHHFGGALGLRRALEETGLLSAS